MAALTPAEQAQISQSSRLFAKLAVGERIANGESGGAIAFTVVTSTPYTIVAADRNLIIDTNTIAGPAQVTLVASAGIGRELTVIVEGSETVTLKADGAEAIMVPGGPAANTKAFATGDGTVVAVIDTGRTGREWSLT